MGERQIRWRAYARDAGPRACMGPAIALMTAAIDRAKGAIYGDDPAEAIAALEDLRGFNSED